MSECAQLEDFDEQLYKVRGVRAIRCSLRVLIRPCVLAAGLWRGRGEVPDRNKRADAVQHAAPQMDRPQGVPHAPCGVLHLFQEGGVRKPVSTFVPPLQFPFACR